MSSYKKIKLTSSHDFFSKFLKFSINNNKTKNYIFWQKYINRACYTGTFICTCISFNVITSFLHIKMSSQNVLPNVLPSSQNVLPNVLPNWFGRTSSQIWEDNSSPAVQARFHCLHNKGVAFVVLQWIWNYIIGREIATQKRLMGDCRGIWLSGHSASFS